MFVVLFQQINFCGRFLETFFFFLRKVWFIFFFFWRLHVLHLFLPTPLLLIDFMLTRPSAA